MYKFDVVHGCATTESISALTPLPWNPRLEQADLLGYRRSKCIVEERASSTA
jgi:hypothetical protein